MHYWSFCAWCVRLGITIFKVYPCHSMCQNSIPFYGQRLFYCICIPNLFVHLSVETFQLLPPFGSSNVAAMNICVQVSVLSSISVVWNIYPGVELLPHMVILCWVALRKHVTVFHRGYTRYVPTSDAQGSSSSTSSSVFVTLFFDYSDPSIKQKVVSHCVFELHFPSGLRLARKSVEPLHCLGEPLPWSLLPSSHLKNPL